MKLISIHMAWNDPSSGPGSDRNTLTHIEFTDDCEFCALETDVLDGDPVVIDGNQFTIYTSEEDWNKKQNGETFQFKDIWECVGNWCWDIIYVTPEECGRLVEWLQKQKHWTLTCADTEIFKHWGTLKGKGFCEYVAEVLA